MPGVIEIEYNQKTRIDTEFHAHLNNLTIAQPDSTDIEPLFVRHFMGRPSGCRFGEARFQRVQNVRLIGFDLEQIIAVLFSEQIQQWTLGEDWVARKEPEGRIGRQQFAQMTLKTSRFIGFVAVDRPLVQRQLGRLGVPHASGLAGVGDLKKDCPKFR